MPTGLRRFYGSHDLHFITCSCYRRRPLLGTRWRRDLFLTIFEQVRQRYRFVVSGYVVMPEHFHLLVGEPEFGTPSTVMQVLKQRFAWSLHRGDEEPESGSKTETGQVWQERFYDFNVWTGKKEKEKLQYMHYNPVKRGLASQPGGWAWSSYRFYSGQAVVEVKLNAQECPLQIKVAGRADCQASSARPEGLFLAPANAALKGRSSTVPRTFREIL